MVRIKSEKDLYYLCWCVFEQVKALFFKSLEALLVVEEQRLRCSDFSFLLESTSFRQSLFACCAVIIAAAYGTVSFVMTTQLGPTAILSLTSLSNLLLTMETNLSVVTEV